MKDMKTVNKSISLGFKDRLAISELLMQYQSNYVEMIIARSMLNDVEIKENEIQEYGLASNANGIFWKKDCSKEFLVTNERLDVIRKALVSLAKEKAIPSIVDTNLFDLINFENEDKLILKEAAKALDDDGLINMSNINIYERIMNK